MLRLGWFSTGRGPGSRNLLREVMDKKKDGSLDIEFSFVFCNWDNTEEPNPRKEQRAQFFKMVDEAAEKIRKNLEALDFGYDRDIDDRTFAPVKNNSDALYVVSLDFSTLCRKRILQQAVAEKLSAALNRAVTKEEGITIRDALMKLQDEGKQIEVACALCYVESARMRSQKSINEFLKNREKAMREYFAFQGGQATQAEAEAAEREAIARENQTPDNPQGLIRGKNGGMIDIRPAKIREMLE